MSWKYDNLIQFDIQFAAIVFIYKIRHFIDDGDYLRNGTCQALFTITKNLYIFLYIFWNVSSLLPVHNLLLIISKEFKQAVIFKLQISSNSIVYLVVQINQPCLKKEWNSIISRVFRKHCRRNVYRTSCRKSQFWKAADCYCNTVGDI